MKKNRATIFTTVMRLRADHNHDFCRLRLQFMQREQILWDLERWDQEPMWMLMEIP